MRKGAIVLLMVALNIHATTCYAQLNNEAPRHPKYSFFKNREARAITEKKVVDSSSGDGQIAMKLDHNIHKFSEHKSFFFYPVVGLTGLLILYIMKVWCSEDEPGGRLFGRIVSYGSM